MGVTDEKNEVSRVRQESFRNAEAFESVEDAKIE
jgi:hypothetical protein